MLFDDGLLWRLIVERSLLMPTASTPLDVLAGRAIQVLVPSFARALSTHVLGLATLPLRLPRRRALGKRNITVFRSRADRI